MSDLISREYMKSLGGACIARRLKDGDLCPIISIDLLPSVQLERIKGKWIKDRDGIYHCSCCGTDYLMYDAVVQDTHYCPNCGCRMEEGDSDE